MTEFNWSPWLFWASAGLTLLPAGLTSGFSKPKSVMIANMISQFGIFTLIISLGALLPAFIFLLSMLLLNISLLLGIITFPCGNDESEKHSLLFSSLRIGICLLFFIVMVYSSAKIASNSTGGKTPANLPFQLDNFDVTLPLILSGLIILLTFMAISRFIKR